MRFIALILATLSAPALAVEVVATIKPIYSLVKCVAGDLAKVSLLISTNSSPHDYQLRPSNVTLVTRADAIFGVSRDFERFLSKLPVQMIELIEAPGVRKLHARGVSCSHGHDHGHDDLHFWGSIDNASAAVNHIASVLQRLDPQNAATYQANTNACLIKLTDLRERVRKALSSASSARMIAMHDGYQYFEQENGLSGVTILQEKHGQLRGGRSLYEAITAVKRDRVQCLLAEANSSKHFVSKLQEATGVRVAYLDIDGVSGRNADDAYFEMMEGNARAIGACLR